MTPALAAVPRLPVALPPVPDVLTEASAARRLAEQLGARWRYDHARNRDLLWDRHHFRPDVDGRLYRLALEAAKLWQHQASLETDVNRRAAVFAWACSLERRGKLENVLALARRLEPIADAGDRWDADPWLLGVPNGVIDLRAGELRDGKPDDRVTMQAGAAFGPEAACPRWERFLLEVFSGNRDLVSYVQRALGYSLTGDMREQCFWLNHGRGRNGKSVLVDVVSHVLGDYAHSIPFSVFELTRAGAGPTPDLAMLPGKRFVSATETNGRFLHAPLLKDLTGGERITAAAKYGHPFTFRPACKIWLSVNELPRVGDDSDGLWRRLKQIPFLEQFGDDRDDRNLKDTLKAEAPGILAWLVRGALAWQVHGLRPPDCVTSATAEYRRDSDQVGRFLEEACELSPGSEVSAADLYKHYLVWADRCALDDRERWTSTMFGRKARERLRRVYTRAGSVYVDVARRFAW